MEKSTYNKRSLGTEGEKAASDFLTKNGYKILCCNFRAGKLGEIDIIAHSGEYICFVEVKTRTSTVFGTPSEAVNYKKRENIKKIAWIYIKQHQLQSSFIRFDVLEILGVRKNNLFEPKNINLIKNAF